MTKTDLPSGPSVIATILDDIEIDSAVRAHFERLACSGSPLLRWAALGFLLDPDLATETVEQLEFIHKGVGHWLERMPRKRLQEIEDLACDEVSRQIKNLQDADPATLDQVKLLEIRAQRDLLESVNRVLLRAERVCVERMLFELNRLIPPKPKAEIVKRSYF